ncbi:MAG: haloacid dehalogenase type II [Gammaproteobacteria bacterium]|nr:MAG: haloacid dehalogenase type II [Gammaproteobacteria bacterium]
MKKITIGFDVYGTLVDPIEISVYLQSLIGNKAIPFAEIWRQKQLEYTFRRGLMNQYQNFDICIQQAMQFAAECLDVSFPSKEEENLLNLYSNLKVFPDVVPAFELLKQNNHTLVAFSNGVESTLNTLLSNAGLINYLADIISVDKLQTFKPNPKVYRYLALKTDADPADCWVISSNPFDVIGGKSAGLNAAWIQRDPSNIFDPWEYAPDITAKNLVEFSKLLNRSSHS